MKKVMLLMMSVVALWSCNNEEKKSDANHAKTEEHHNVEHSETIQLNRGEKWVVNNEMKPFVSEGENLVNSYLKNEQNDYKALASQLKTQNSQLLTLRKNNLKTMI